MKRKQRETTIFSLSAIDLFCSAMGVFMILCFIVFPFYRNSEAEPQQEQNAETEQKPVGSLLIAIKWEVWADTSEGPQWCSLDDYDLHVEAPAPDGHVYHYYFERTSVPQSPARLVTDSTHGGNEVWLHPCVTPGEYKVSYALYGKTPGVTGRGQTRLTLITMSGEGKTNDFGPMMLGADLPADKGNRLYPLATIRVNPDGSIAPPIFHNAPPTTR